MKLPIVCFMLITIDKSFRANITTTQLSCFSVLLMMKVQLDLGDETFVADFTDVGIFTSVNTLMDDKIVSKVE